MSTRANNIFVSKFTVGLVLVTDDEGGSGIVGVTVHCVNGMGVPVRAGDGGAGVRSRQRTDANGKNKSSGRKFDVMRHRDKSLRVADYLFNSKLNNNECWDYSEA